MDTFVELLQSLPQVLGPVLATLFGLITLDLGLGIALAVRNGVFRWAEVTKFYRTNVLPYAVIAVSAAGAAQFISVEILPAALADQVAGIGTLLGVGPMFAHLILGSILPNARALMTGQFKWQITNPELSAAVAAVGAGEDNLKAALESWAPPVEDIVALNEDGTAVDFYDGDTLAHVGSETVLPPAIDPVYDGSLSEPAPEPESFTPVLDLSEPIVEVVPEPVAPFTPEESDESGPTPVWLEEVTTEEEAQPGDPDYNLPTE